MKKLEAIEYLIEHSVYGNEWSGAGMWHAVMEVMRHKNTGISKDFLDKQLQAASEF